MNTILNNRAQEGRQVIAESELVELRSSVELSELSRAKKLSKAEKLSRAERHS